MTTPIPPICEKLREDAKHGVGAAMDWSDRECADYWAGMCHKARRNASEASETIIALVSALEPFAAGDPYSIGEHHLIDAERAYKRVMEGENG